MTPQRYLRLQFSKHVKKGYCKNAELDPLITAFVRETVEEGEEVIGQDLRKDWGSLLGDGSAHSWEQRKNNNHSVSLLRSQLRKAR
jgi:hypothetical protein